MILNNIIVIVGYLSFAIVLSYIVAELDIRYTEPRIKKDLTNICIRLGLLIIAILLSTGFVGLLMKLLGMI